MPSCTAKRKIEQIEFYGGRRHFVVRAPVKSMPPPKDWAGALERSLYGSVYLRRTGYRLARNNNIADSIFRQMSHEPHPQPLHIVMSAGPALLSATIGRCIRSQGFDTQLLVVDPQNSVF